MNWRFIQAPHLPDAVWSSFLFKFLLKFLPPSTQVPITDGDLSDHQIGTDDVLAGTSNSTSQYVGDAGRNMLDHALGGNDTFTLTKVIFYSVSPGRLFCCLLVTVLYRDEKAIKMAFPQIVHRSCICYAVEPGTKIHRSLLIMHR